MSDSQSGRTLLSASVLQQILDAKGWSQYELENRSKVHRSTISMQLGPPWRPIRGQHLSGYLRALDSSDRKMLLSAWLRDLLGSDLVDEVVDRETNRVREDVLEWAPSLRPSDKKMLDWLAQEMVSDPQSCEMIRSVCKRIGFKQP
jgi:transcriptional regulator with XRE-family HTH domain